MTPISNKKLSADGFTLLEIVVAMGLIAIALVSVIQLHSHNIDLQTEAQLISTVNFLATSRLAEIGADKEIQIGSSSGEFGEEYSYFRYKQAVERTADLENLYKVTLTIHTDEPDSGREFVFETYIYRKKA